MQDRLEKNKKSQNQFQNWLMQIRRTRVKKGQRIGLSETKEKQNIVKDILKNKIKQIKKNTNLLHNILTHTKKERCYLKKD